MTHKQRGEGNVIVQKKKKPGDVLQWNVSLIYILYVVLLALNKREEKVTYSVGVICLRDARAEGVEYCAVRGVGLLYKTKSWTIYERGRRWRRSCALRGRHVYILWCAWVSRNLLYNIQSVICIICLYIYSGAYILRISASFPLVLRYILYNVISLTILTVIFFFFI